ncbi:MAG: exosome complex protein Rrp42 [Candidatus Bathyarchaeia archaeon]
MSRRFEVVSRLKTKRISESIAQGKREDGRGLTDFRTIKIAKGILEKAEGSAEVSVGDTRVVAGVKVEIGNPFSDTPNLAVQTVNSEFTPIASPAFEPGPPDELSIEVARIVDRGIRSSNTIDLEKYCIIPGKAVYVMFIDIFVLNHAGNLIDTSALAAIAALQNTKIQKYASEGDEVKLLEEQEPLELQDLPIAVTVGKIVDSLFVDPTVDEEDILGTRLTVTINKDGRICSLQKNGSEGLTLEEIKKAINIAREKTAEIRKLLMES